GLEDRGAPRIELLELGQAVADGHEGDLVQVAGGFLAVAGDEGDGGFFLQQADGGVHAGGGQGQLGGDHRRVALDHGGHFITRTAGLLYKYLLVLLFGPCYTLRTAASGKETGYEHGGDRAVRVGSGDGALLGGAAF